MAVPSRRNTLSPSVVERIVADVKDHGIFKIRSTLLPLDAGSTNLFTLLGPLDRAFGRELEAATKDLESLRLSKTQKAIVADGAQFWAPFKDQDMPPPRYNPSSPTLAHLSALVFSVDETHGLGPTEALRKLSSVLNRSQRLFARFRFEVIRCFRYNRSHAAKDELLENLLLVTMNTKMDLQWLNPTGFQQYHVAYINDISLAQLHFVLSHLRKFVWSTSMRSEIQAAEARVLRTGPKRFMTPSQIEWLKYKAPNRPPGRVPDTVSRPPTTQPQQTARRPVAPAGNTSQPDLSSQSSTALTLIAPVTPRQTVRESPNQQTPVTLQRRNRSPTTVPPPLSHPPPSSSSLVRSSFREGSLERLEMAFLSSQKQYVECLDYTIDDRQAVLAVSQSKIAELTPKKRQAEREVKDLKARLKIAEADRDEKKLLLTNQKLESSAQTKELWVYKEKRRKLDAGLSIPNYRTRHD